MKGTIVKNDLLPPVSGPPVNSYIKTEDIPVLEKSEAEFLPPKIVLNAVEGWGKTSCGAFAFKPAILMAKGETGYKTLLGTGAVPSVLNAEFDSWNKLMTFLDAQIATEKLEYKTLVFDALGGLRVTS